jgi:hypothetical protein
MTIGKSGPKGPNRFECHEGCVRFDGDRQDQRIKVDVILRDSSLDQAVEECRSDSDSSFIGIILYLTFWYARRHRARIVAAFMTAIALSGVFGGPISGWIMSHLAGAAARALDEELERGAIFEQLAEVGAEHSAVQLVLAKGAAQEEGAAPRNRKPRGKNDRLAPAAMCGGVMPRSQQVNHVALELVRVLVFVHRDYGLPPFVDKNTLIIASSYSGETEETLSAFQESLKTPAKKPRNAGRWSGNGDLSRWVQSPAQ